jgi:hypothetical protein
MGKFRSLGSRSNDGDVMVSGIFGMFGSVVHCDSNDTSFYCSMVKIINLLMMFIYIAAICYLLYFYVKPSLFEKR